MAVNLEKLVQRIETLEQNMKELYRMVLELQENMQDGKSTGGQTQAITVKWWQTWKQGKGQR